MLGDQTPHVNNISQVKTSPHPSEGCHGTHFSTSQVGQPTCPVPICAQTHTTPILCNRMHGLLPQTLFSHSQGQNDFREDKL